MKGKVHLRSHYSLKKYVCGVSVSPWTTGNRRHASITCKRCLKKIEKNDR